MDLTNFNITNEFDQLTHVIMGTSRGYHRDPKHIEIVNSTQQNTFDATGLPTEKILESDFHKFRTKLEEYGIQVYQPVIATNAVQDQTCPRDIGFVIGDTLVIANMRNESRKREFEGIRHLVAQWDGRVVLVPDGTFLEGGDVIIDGVHVFVGHGQRSSPDGYDFMQQNFRKDFDIIPLQCKSASDGEEILHLDCTFNVLGLGHALIYPPGLVSIPDVIHDKYQWIEVDKSEAAALATNVFSIAHDTVIARFNPACARVNSILKELGYRVIELPFDAVPSIGGSFRCATLPLRRVRPNDATPQAD